MRYILLIIAIMGGLLSFNSNAALINQCSISAPPVYGSYTYFLSGGFMHIDLDGCDYFSHDNLVLVNEDVPSGSPISHEGNWYPSGKKSNEVAHDKPFTSSLSQQTDQLNRYCAQSRKCDSKGLPVNISDWLKFKEKDDAEHKNPSEKPGDKPSDADKPGSGSSGDSGSSSGDGSTPAGSGTGTPDGTDIGSGTISGSTDGSTSGSSSGSSTPSPSEPEKPYPDNADFSQLIKSYHSCSAQLDKLPQDNKDISIVNAYNNAADICASILVKAASIIPVGEMILPSDEHHEFYYKDHSGTIFSCSRNPHQAYEYMDPRDYPGVVIGEPLLVSPLEYYPPDSVLFNYSYNSYDYKFCNSVYETYVSSLNKPSKSDSSSSGSSADNPLTPNIPSSEYPDHYCKPGTTYNGSYCAYSSPESCPSGSKPYYNDSSFLGCVEDLSSVDSGGSFGAPVSQGSGHVNSGDGDNGDVVAAINAFHADANRDHKETMDALDFPVSATDSIKNGLSSDINALIDSTKKGLTDSYNDALSELKGVFGDIYSYVPDIKLSFDLPIQFTAGIMGRCVPLVFDFNISLVGLPSYHLYAEGIQACKLYDLYVRSIVEYMLYFMTALACRRVFTRAAEFITSQS